MGGRPARERRQERRRLLQPMRPRDWEPERLPEIECGLHARFAVLVDAYFQDFEQRLRGSTLFNHEFVHETSRAVDRLHLADHFFMFNYVIGRASEVWTRVTQGMVATAIQEERVTQAEVESFLLAADDGYQCSQEVHQIQEQYRCWRI